jgi:hypothetical protein
MSNISGMSVATPTTVYAWPKSREEFDLLARIKSAFTISVEKLRTNRH